MPGPAAPSGWSAAGHKKSNARWSAGGCVPRRPGVLRTSMSLVLPISHRPSVMKSASSMFSTCMLSLDIFAARPNGAQGETTPRAACAASGAARTMNAPSAAPRGDPGFLSLIPKQRASIQRTGCRMEQPNLARAIEHASPVAGRRREFVWAAPVLTPAINERRLPATRDCRQVGESALAVAVWLGVGY